jgi:hypothetical protein
MEGGDGVVIIKSSSFLIPLFSDDLRIAAESRLTVKELIHFYHH